LSEVLRGSSLAGRAKGCRDIQQGFRLARKLIAAPVLHDDHGMYWPPLTSITCPVT
jgi:hypothetical protein